MALDISATQARGNMAAVRDQWVSAHLEQITAVISAASDSGEMAASYELQVGVSEEAGLERVMEALTVQGFSVVRRGKRTVVKKSAVRRSLADLAAGNPVPEGETGHKEDVVLDISWAEEEEVSEDASGFSLPLTPAPLI
ncbi:hypothetical protein [Stenotrophomonas maltophilia]|uniref:hypothetical protein n=1 Tax=Stenotrophomonas maltophilia TaxID=40324 RepID=UPI000C1465D0|nr:hypothetical protein [Stenotrophomonas maltophilia]HDS3802530.1 hypothetical protein [Stenotrophomonas maltophilia]HDX0828579.1 hypothetical protein [Stenotrophomonas maltophilia]HDX0845729.1 hypothetical protein [Stenotrophomonas maltophilia]HDX0869586.1 hypothetical protein [Stenotrophomonas maltophilia]HDX0958916.1 hypothetical protein [Stenotrophomonas maltophilia]